ncbi:MAG: hypothetical protein AAFP26_11845, partial [Planctomycetota bacterium]
MPLTFSGKHSGTYVIGRAPDCSKLKWTDAKQQRADIYGPVAHSKVLRGHACTAQRVTRDTTFHFFGTFDVDGENTTMRAPGTAECREWRDRRMSRWGALEPVGAGTWATANAAPNATWPWSERGEAENAIVTEVELVYDKITRQVTSFVDQSPMRCQAERGVCRTDSYVFIFQPQPSECPELHQKLANETEVFLHDNEHQQYLAAPGIDLAFSSFGSCSDRVRGCMSEHYTALKCTINNFIIGFRESGDVSDSLEDTFRRETERHSAQLEAVDANVLQLVQAQSASMEEHRRRLTFALLRLHCANTRRHRAGLLAAQKLSPSRALSLLLNRPARAVLSGDVMQEMVCVNVTARLLPTIRLARGRVSSRPIFDATLGSETFRAQWMLDGYLRPGVADFLAEMPHNATNVFVVADRTLLFRNGTLTRERPDVTPIGPTRARIDFPVVRHNADFARHLLAVAAPPLDVDVASAQVRAVTEVTRAYLRASGMSTGLLDKFLGAPVSPEDHDRFMRRVESMFSVGLARRALEFLTTVWAVGIVLVVVVWTFQLAKRRLRKIRRKERADPDEQEKDEVSEEMISDEGTLP